MREDRGSSGGREIATIGVYGFGRDSFLATLRDAGVNLVLELREAQYREDARRGEGKRSRTVLAADYVRGYTEQILDPVDLGPIVGFIGESRAALLCVERDARACHRSLVAVRLSEEHGFEIRELSPPG